MKNIILIGSGGHSRPIISVIQSSTNFDLKGVIDIHYKDNNKEKILGIPVIGPLSILEKYKNKEMYVFLTLCWPICKYWTRGKTRISKYS